MSCFCWAINAQSALNSTGKSMDRPNTICPDEALCVVGYVLLMAHAQAVRKGLNVFSVGIDSPFSISNVLVHFPAPNVNAQSLSWLADCGRWLACPLNHDFCMAPLITT